MWKKFLNKCEDEEWIFKLFAIMVYGMVIFPKVLNHVEAVIVDLVEQVDNQANPIPTIVVKTISSLNFYWKKGEGEFIGCVQLLYIWIRSHFWGTYTKSLKHYMDSFVPLKEFKKKEWPMHQLGEQRVAVLWNLDFDNVTWKASWFNNKSTIYGYGDKLWVPLIGLWGIVSYTSLLVLRQYGSKQFISTTYELNHLGFDYGGLGYVNQLIELLKIWKEPRRMDLGKHVCDVAPGYLAWRLNRVKNLTLPLSMTCFN